MKENVWSSSAYSGDKDIFLRPKASGSQDEHPCFLSHHAVIECVIYMFGHYYCNPELIFLWIH